MPGVMRVRCANDTLSIIDYAYNNAANSLINAEQKE